MARTSMYFDYAAATPVHPRVVRAMLPFFSEKFGNPSSIHRFGVEAREAVEGARKAVSRLLHAHADEILFTSGATESVNLAILGAARAYAKHGKHVITSAAEHKATLEVLKSEGFLVTVLPVSKLGGVASADVAAALQKDTILVSLFYANNEVGTLNPIREIGREIMRFRKAHDGVLPLFHVDATQTVPYVDIDVEKEKIDLASFSAGKMAGPKGIGALYVRRGAEVRPLYFGGGQESALRPGTENVPGIVGFGVAADRVEEERKQEAERLQELKREFLTTLLAELPDVSVNGDSEHTIPHIVNLRIGGIADVEELVLRLDADQVIVSAASACTNASTRSHVLQAMGYTPEEIRSSVRVSFGYLTKKSDVLRGAKVIARVVKRLRSEG